MRLKNGSLWPIPITWNVSYDFIQKIKNSDRITLKDKEGFTLAVLCISDIWKPDLELESKLVYGTTDEIHPGVNYLLNKSSEYYIGGKIIKITLPNHYDFQEYRHSPKQLKSEIKKRKWDKIIAFQTRNPLHKAHVEMTKRAMNEFNAKATIAPAVGDTKPGDLDYFTRVGCYEHLLNEYDPQNIILSLLPIAMRMAGPREALWHALIRRNYGCTHFIVGRDHAGPGLNSKKVVLFMDHMMLETLLKYSKEINIKTIPFKFLVYLPSKSKYEEIENIPEDIKYLQYLEQNCDRC